MMMQDVTAPPVVEIVISEDGDRVWINGELECLFRACRIGKLVVRDERKVK